MFEHLTDPKFDTPESLPPDELASAAIRTLGWLDDPLDADLSPNAKTLARNAFASLTDPSTPPEVTTRNILSLRAPQAVQHLVAMLGQYDHDFITQAKEIRAYCTNVLLAETNSGDARIRLRATELLGKVAGVDLYMERSEVIHKVEPAGEIEDRIRARLKAMLPPLQPVEDVEVREIAVIKHAYSVHGVEKAK